MNKWHVPLDPDCLEVDEYIRGLYDDPMTNAIGAPVDDIMASFESKHRFTCKRCQEYGAANIEVI